MIRNIGGCARIVNRRTSVYAGRPIDGCAGGWWLIILYIRVSCFLHMVTAAIARVPREQLQQQQSTRLLRLGFCPLVQTAIIII